MKYASKYAVRFSLAIALTLPCSSVLAATAEENYLAARDKFIARLNPPGDPVAPTDAASKEMEQARAELLKQMRGVIGPLDVKGFSGEGDYNVGSLFKGDMEAGILDGLVFKKGKDVQLLVTTTSLSDLWIKSPDGLAAEEGAVPKDVPSAMTQDDFYTRAINNDSAAGNMGELPVTKPAGVEFAFAMLAARRQDYFPVPADEILIGVIVPPRVYIVEAPTAKIRMMPSCAKQFNNAIAKLRGKNAPDDTMALEEKADEAMRKCFAERVKSDPAFARATKQAQDYIDLLARKSL